MGRAEHCQSGTEITTQDECNEALTWASALQINLSGRKQLITGSWDHVPYQCSYQAGGDQSFHFNQAFHFNLQQTNDVPDFINGGYIMICKKGKKWVNNKTT